MPAKKQKKKSTTKTNWFQWLFVLGILVAIVGAKIDSVYTVPLLLVIGLVLGIEQIWATKETTKYLVGVLGVIFIATATAYTVYLPLVKFLQYIIVLLLPGTVLVAFKAFWNSY